MKSTSCQPKGAMLIEYVQQSKDLGLDKDLLHGHYLSLIGTPADRNGKFEQFVKARIAEEVARQFFSPNENTGPVGDPATGILLGKIIDSGLPYFLNLLFFATHILVIAASGKGKTNMLVQIIIGLLAKGIKVHFFDHKDTGCNFLNVFPDALFLEPRHERWNLFKGFVDQQTRNAFVARCLGDYASSHPSARNTLNSILADYCHDPDDLPSLQDIAGVVSKIGGEDSAKHQNLSNALFNICKSIGDLSRVRIAPEPPLLGKELIIFSRKSIPARQENLLISSACTQEWERLTATGHDSSLHSVHAWDEGLKFFGATGETSQHGLVQREKITKDRSYGIGNILCTQSVKKLLPDAVDNCSSVIALGMNNPKEAELTARIMGLNSSQEADLLNLPPGEAYIYTGSGPVQKIKIPYHDLGRGKSRAEIEQLMTPHWEELHSQATYSPKIKAKVRKLDFRVTLGERTSPEESEDNSPEKRPPEPILEETLLLLSSCRGNPAYGVVQHYRNLGWSSGRGNRVKSELLSNDLLASRRVVPSAGGRPKEVLTLTPKGESFLEQYEKDA
ncbi:ATP-binding protein [Puniceicoccales bacterium CK1056]|uniref:ATP-binding protein n=1 Tax=Oceanipulchritudo coccoides TaxID=2706888 RepID=A0A6B2M6R9_9BACT|nr:ATP-binding protein [Oceanipulchritudo coccoides]NDV63350.1 ATP-binding protein [Oceanipulchritudo coccoides]